MKYSVKTTSGFQYYESETEPPKTGPLIWLRPSDGAHFARNDEGWFQYNPVHMECRLKPGQSIKVLIPTLS